MAEIRLTKEGIAEYEERLDFLKTVRRTEIVEQIKIARSFGDLSENAEYDAAKLEQARNEYEIAEVENILRNAVVIDEDAITTDVVSVGSLVKVKLLSMNTEAEYHIVGSAEANPLKNRISDASPVGKALLGCERGQVVEVQAPGGVMKIEILDIGK